MSKVLRSSCRNCTKRRCRSCRDKNCYCASQGHNYPKLAGPSGLSLGGATQAGCCGTCLGGTPVRGGGGHKHKPPKKQAKPKKKGWW